MEAVLKLVVSLSLSIVCISFPDRPPNIFINVAKIALTVFTEIAWCSFLNEATKPFHKLTDWLQQEIKMDRTLMRPKLLNGVVALQFDFNQWFKWLFAVWILIDCLIKLRILLSNLF